MGEGRKAVAAWLRKHVVAVAIAVFGMMAAALVLNISLKLLVVLPLLVLVASFSTFYFNYVSLPVNFELVKLATIVTAVSHGFVPGLAVGLSSTFFGKVLIGRIDEKLPLSMTMITLLALAASLFSGADIATLGMALVLLYNGAMLLLSITMGGDLSWNLPYEGTNFLFNLLLFTKAAPILQGIVA